ncbi:MAG: DUF3293 domain-containing protein [Burkholderiales bacterium]|nr:DUF3293 domain-containing protein [Burkholderiales bacterium]
MTSGNPRLSLESAYLRTGYLILAGVSARDAADHGKRAAQERAYRSMGMQCVEVRVGRRCAVLDRLLHRLGVREWLFITAWNPHSRPLPRWRNRARQRALQRALRRNVRVLYCGLGVPDDRSWRSEHSVFAGPVAAGRARRLGRQFRQNAVVIGRRGGVPVLLWTNGKDIERDGG